MDYRVKSLVLLGLLWAAAGVADDRLAVLEFFGRPHGAFCSAAGPAMITLQSQMQGRAVLLEYDFDAFPDGRVDRFWATGTSASFLPLVMVGSGFRTSSGSVNYETVYRAMINDELARSPRAAVTAYWRRAGNAMRVYAELTNTGSTNLSPGEAAAIWVIAWENAHIGVSMTWVRSTVRQRLNSTLSPGETVTVVIDTPAIYGINWNRLAGLAMVENRPGGSGSYDMLQAAEALPAGFTVLPANLLLHARQPVSEVALAGPHVLAWTAASEQPWIRVTPASGTGSATVTVTLLPDLRPPSEVDGSITFDAAGDDMVFTKMVDITVGTPVRRAIRRVAPQ